MLKGGCFCGLIRYEAAGAPFHETNLGWVKIFC